MPEAFVTLAAYHMSVEAELVRGRLEAEGIQAFLTGGGSVGVFGGIQGLGGMIQLRVSETDAERAAEILAAHEKAEGDGGEERLADDSVLWLCPLCGEAVSDDLEVCPSCETPRPAPTKSPAVTAVPRHNPASQDVQEKPAPKAETITSDTPLEAVPSTVEDDLNLPNLETMVGDDLVRRAFLSSLFPLLMPYSFWLLARLGFYSGEVSPRMMRKLYWTIAIDAFWCLGILLGGLPLILFLVFGRTF